MPNQDEIILDLVEFMGSANRAINMHDSQLISHEARISELGSANTLTRSHTDVEVEKIYKAMIARCAECPAKKKMQFWSGIFAAIMFILGFVGQYIVRILTSH